MPPFPTHDLLADFNELRRRLLLILEDDSPTAKARLVDAFLLACGLNQIIEDYMGDGGAVLIAVARVVDRGAPRPMKRLSSPLNAAADFFQRGRDGGPSRERQRELADVVDALADDVVRTRKEGGAPVITCRELVERCVHSLEELSAAVQSRVIRLPTCFRSLDQDPEDFGRLIDRFAELQPDRVHPILVVGLRSSGSYTAPLCAANLRGSGYQRVETITIRPQQQLLPTEVKRIRTAVRTSATVMLTDDPPNTGSSMVAVVKKLEALGADRGRIVIALPLIEDHLPEPLAAYCHVTLPARLWAIHDRLSVAAIRASLDRLLAGRTIQVENGANGCADVRVASVRSVTRLSLPPIMDLKSGRPARRHVRALYRCELEDDAGRVHEHRVYVKGTGLGYLGDHSLAVSEPLHEYFPAVYGVSDQLMFRAWLPDEWNLAGRQGSAPRDLSRRLARYVLARRDALATDRDITDRLAGDGPLWKQASLVLLRVFGKLRLVALPVTDRAALQLLQPSQPSVIDGSMALTEWFAEPGADEGRIRKVNFDERAFCNQDLVKNLHCYDALHDLASAAADYDARTAERGDGEEFVDSLKREYEKASGGPVSEERWLLHQLIHTITNQQFTSEALGVRKGAARLQMAVIFETCQRVMSRAVQRYYRSRFFRDLQVPTHGPLCAIDIDGVLESDQLGFPATTPAGAMALRALTSHGYRPVLVTGRSLDEVRERCRAYGLAGGVAEYGAVVYERHGDHAVNLAAEDSGLRLETLRRRFAADPGIHVDGAYRAIVRAYRFDRHGRPRHLESSVLKALSPELARLRLRQIDGAYQTDFVPEEVDKGGGIRRLQDELGDGTPARLVLAVGDGQPDLAVFALATRAFVPANAHDDVRAASRKMPNLRVLRQRAQLGLSGAVASAIGHRPGKCLSCAPPSVDADGRLLLTLLSAQDGRKLHKLVSILSAGLQLALPGPARRVAHGDNALLAIGREAGRRLVKGEGLVGSSGLLFTGNLVARGVGLLFVVAAARLLGPADYGLLAYALVIVNFGTVLITNCPAGLSGFLARNAGNRAEQDRYFSNWVAVVTAMLAVSLVAIVPIGLLAGLRGWMIPALMANLLGIAIFETYRTSQRGLARFRSLTGIYILANLVQLVAVLVAGLAGFRDAALFVTIYGLSNLAALLVMEIAAPTPLRFVIRSIQPRLAHQIALLSWPLLLQTAFFAAWFGSDLILVRHFLAAPLAGDYAASKTLVNLIGLPAGAIGSAVIPQIAGLSGPPFRRQTVRALALAAAIVVPLMLVLVALRGPIVRLVFGSKYPNAVDAIPWLGLGMAAYAFYVVLESVWIGLGRPAIDAVATGAGMLVTVIAGLLLVPSAGLIGAAGAFALGAGVQLATIGLFTAVAYARSVHAGLPLGRTASLEATAVMNSGTA